MDLLSASIPPIPKPSKPSLAISSDAPSPFKDSITTQKKQLRCLSPQIKKQKSRAPRPAHASQFLARVLIHIPQPNQHSILYYGHYARRTRKYTRKNRPAADDNELNATQRKNLRRRWANLIRPVFKTDPLICKNCGGKMRIVSFITEPSVIRQILDHLQNRNSRDPPGPYESLPRA